MPAVAGCKFLRQAGFRRQMFVGMAGDEFTSKLQSFMQEQPSRTLKRRIRGWLSEVKDRPRKPSAEPLADGKVIPALGTYICFDDKPGAGSLAEHFGEPTKPSECLHNTTPNVDMTKEGNVVTCGDCGKVLLVQELA